jgi:hypothetical protein
MAQTSTERRLPEFKEKQIVEEAAKLTILTGQLLQDKVVDVQSTFSVHGSDDKLYFNHDPQVHNIQPLKMGRMTQFLFTLPDVFGNSVECYTHTFFGSESQAEVKERLVLDENGEVVCVTEEREGYRGDFAQTGVREASIDDIFEIAKEATANAEDRPGNIERDKPYVSGRGMEGRLMLAQANFIPILGRLAAIAGDFVLDRRPDTRVDANIKISTCHYRMYGSESWSDKVSNQVNFWGVNRSTGIGATFECKAYPLAAGNHDLAIVEANMLVDDRSQDDGAHLTKDVMVLNGSLRRRRRTRIASQEPRTVGEYPANLNTIVKLAERAVSIVRSEDQ